MPLLLLYYQCIFIKSSALVLLSQVSNLTSNNNKEHWEHHDYILITRIMMRTGQETSTRTHYMFRGLIHGFEGFTQVIIAMTIEVSICRRGPARLYLGHEVRTPKEPKESYYNLETWNWWVGWKRINKPYGLYVS